MEGREGGRENSEPKNPNSYFTPSSLLFPNRQFLPITVLLVSLAAVFISCPKHSLPQPPLSVWSTHGCKDRLGALGQVLPVVNPPVSFPGPGAFPSPYSQAGYHVGKLLETG